MLLLDQIAKSNYNFIKTSASHLDANLKKKCRVGFQTRMHETYGNLWDNVNTKTIVKIMLLGHLQCT